MRVTFCGVRGSTPVAGAEFDRYGGRTSCVALAHDGEDPTLVIDAGTGLKRLSMLLEDRPFRGTVLLSHLHLDHIQGLGFFPAAEQGRVDVRLPAQGDAEELLSRVFGPPVFPIRPDQLPGDWSFCGIEPGEHGFGGWSVRALEIPHGGGRTFGYRVSDGSAVVAYLADHCPTQLGRGPDGWGEYHDAARRIAAGADLLIHDTMITGEELEERAYLGHACGEYAVRLARLVGVGRVALYHHDPDRTDAQVDDIVAGLGDGSGVFAAAEGQAVDVSAVPMVHARAG